MEAAARGHSTLGIPAKVRREFVKADSMRKSLEKKPKGAKTAAPGYGR